MGVQSRPYSMLCACMTASNEFDAAALENANIPVYAIGDAAGKAADISNAIRTGYDTACQL